MDDHLGTDMGVYGRNVASGSMYNGIYRYDPDWRVIESSWSTSYEGVRDANFLLSGISKSSLSDEVKGRVTAQGLFYRAIFYWQLTVNFGDVPYWRDAIVMEDVSILGKTSATAIQQEMIADLETAISSGYMSTSKWNENNSLPTVWAARMLKAYYHMWLKEWDKARIELNTVITTSPHGTTLADYADLYREGNEKHDEIIFGREFLKTAPAAQSNNAHTNAHWNNAGENAGTKTVMGDLDIWQSTAGITLRKSFADTYDSDDSRRIYNVWESKTDAVTNKTTVFNWIYIPKLMRSIVPESDPLMITADLNKESSASSIIFRLSEAYLCLAEAEFMIDGSSDAALAAINKVRLRSNLPALLTMTHQDIRNERGWELVAEGFTGRKKDLVRWGMLESTVLATPAAERAAGAYSLAIQRAEDDSVIIAGAAIGKFQIFPVPLAEITKSNQIGGALVQNPLWE
jgi:hypothetical protein